MDVPTKSPTEFHWSFNMFYVLSLTDFFPYFLLLWAHCLMVASYSECPDLTSLIQRGHHYWMPPTMSHKQFLSWSVLHGQNSQVQTFLPLSKITVVMKIYLTLHFPCTQAFFGKFYLPLRQTDVSSEGFMIFCLTHIPPEHLPRVRWMCRRDMAEVEGSGKEVGLSH